MKKRQKQRLFHSFGAVALQGFVLGSIVYNLTLDTNFLALLIASALCGIFYLEVVTPEKFK
jgi:hypothetical protein